MIFEKGRHSQYDFYIYNTAIEVVDSFKYLGITLFKMGIGIVAKNALLKTFRLLCRIFS